MTNIEQKLQKFNALAYPTWKRVGGIDGIDVNLTNNKGNSTIEGLKEWKKNGAKVYHISKDDRDLVELLYHPYDDELQLFEGLSYGTNPKYVLEAEVFFGSGHLIQLPDNTKFETPLVLNYSLDSDKKSMIDYNYIHIGKGSSATIVILYSSVDTLESGYHNGLTKIFAQKDANLKIIKIQTFSSTVSHIDNTVAYLNQNSEVMFSSFDFGGKKVISDYGAHLIGDEAKSTALTAYLGDGKRKLDIGYNTIHYGKRTESLIECRGALLDESKKIFRGNLKFEKGAKKAIGRESEYVLLLDPKVHSDAIPALLCDEDDVIGEHAASAGQVDEQQLFYIMSRGFSMKEAKKLVIHGSFSGVIDCLPTSKLKEFVENELERRLVNA